MHICNSHGRVARVTLYLQFPRQHTKYRLLVFAAVTVVAAMSRLARDNLSARSGDETKHQ